MSIFYFFYEILNVSVLMVLYKQLWTLFIILVCPIATCFGYQYICVAVCGGNNRLPFDYIPFLMVGLSSISTALFWPLIALALARFGFRLKILLPFFLFLFFAPIVFALISGHMVWDHRLDQHGARYWYFSSYQIKVSSCAMLSLEPPLVWVQS